MFAYVSKRTFVFIINSFKGCIWMGFWGWIIW